MEREMNQSWWNLHHFSLKAVFSFQYQNKSNKNKRKKKKMKVIMNHDCITHYPNQKKKKKKVSEINNEKVSAWKEK